MLGYTVKNYLNNLIKVAGDNKYEIEFIGNESKRRYTFNISKAVRSKEEPEEEPITPVVVNKGKYNKVRREQRLPKVFVVLETEDVCLRQPIEDINEFVFKDETLTPVNFIETIFKGDDEIYECNSIKIHYPAQLYVKVFKLMRDRVSFMFRDNTNEYYYCYYVEGKVLFIEETDTEYIVRGTNLYHLANSHPDYEILAINNPLKRYMYGEYLDIQREIANKKGKEFIKIVKDKRVCEDD